MLIEDDLIIIAGSGPEETRLTADSHILRKFSSVFDKMLGPNFAEGKMKTITLPDDSPWPLEVVFDITHFRYDQWTDGVLDESVGLGLDIETVRGLAVLSDKYDIPMIRVHMRRWLERSGLEDCGGEEWIKWAETAFIVKDDEQFREATRYLVFCHDESFLGLFDAMGDYLLYDCLLLLQEKKAKMIQEISTELFDIVAREACPCDFSHHIEVKEKIGNLLRTRTWASMLQGKDIDSVTGHLNRMRRRLFETSSIVGPDAFMLCTNSQACSTIKENRQEFVARMSKFLDAWSNQARDNAEICLADVEKLAVTNMS